MKADAPRLHNKIASHYCRVSEFSLSKERVNAEAPFLADGGNAYIETAYRMLPNRFR